MFKEEVMTKYTLGSPDGVYGHFFIERILPNMLKVFSVFDSKVSMYLPPFFMRATGEALRGWETVCNDSTSNFFRYPSDFTLFEIGTFDESTGIIHSHSAKISLGTALEFKKSSPSGEGLLRDYSSLSARDHFGSPSKGV